MIEKLYAFTFLRTDVVGGTCSIEVHSASDTGAWVAAAELAGRQGCYGTGKLVLTQKSEIGFTPVLDSVMNQNYNKDGVAEYRQLRAVKHVEDEVEEDSDDEQVYKCRTCEKTYKQGTETSDYKGYCSMRCQHTMAKRVGYKKTKGGQTEFSVLKQHNLIGNVPA